MRGSRGEGGKVEQKANWSQWPTEREMVGLILVDSVSAIQKKSDGDICGKTKTNSES